MPINNDGLAKDPHTHLHTGEVPSICLGYQKILASIRSLKKIPYHIS